MQQSCIRPCKQRRKRRGSYFEIRFTVPDVLMLYCVLSICCRWRKSSATRKTKDILRLSEQEQALPGNLPSVASEIGIQGFMARKSNDDTRGSPPSVGRHHGLASPFPSSVGCH